MRNENNHAIPDGAQNPSQVPDFDMIRPVGRGGFGQVWLAANRTTAQLRAVKIIPLHEPGQKDPATREIASLTRLQANVGCHHANLMTIHHVGKTANHLFYVMDPADDVHGGPASNSPDYRPATLQSRLQRGPLSAEVCMAYAAGLLAGLAALHAAAMVHRDVKPANCLFVDGRLKLADFGLVSEAHPSVSRVGTQTYMPPDGRMDMRADVYAAGLVIYEMISGLPADDFPSLGRQSENVRNNPLLASLLRLVLHACERDPRRRPADARVMLAELMTTVRAARRSPGRHPLAVISATAVLAAAVLAAWSFAPSQGKLCDVNFVSVPYEATIYLDGVLQRDAQGNAYTTPCTICNLRARVCSVGFQCEGTSRWNAGTYDLAQTQQIVARRPY